MRISRILMTSAIALISAGVMAGCSGGGSTMSQSVVPTGGAQSHAVTRDNTGVAPKYLTMLHFGNGLPAVRPDASGAPKFLAVSDFGTGAVEILNKNYALVKTITDGLSGPDGDWYDPAGNLYVANYSGVTVQEYAPGSSSPSFTYTAGLGDPINVTTDEAGNVYVADYNFGGSGFVNEYAQGSNVVINSCSPGGAPEGLAVGEKAVFVSYNNGSTANIIEYKNGLAGCHGHVLGVGLTFAGGMQLDNHKNLVACDQIAGAIDIIAPPYSSVTSSITGFFDPFHVALNRSNTLVFVADVANANVVVDDYPSGTNVTTLGSANGLSDPAGVAATCTNCQ